jgi:WD40 repeat protein
VFDHPLLALSRDGALAAAVLRGQNERSGSVLVWRAETGERLCRIEAAATALAFEPGGTLLATGDSEGRIVLWTLPSGERRGSLEASHSRLHSLAFSPDGHRLAAGDAGGGLYLWAWEAGRCTPCPGSLYDVYALSFSPDGTLLASGGRSPVKLWDAASGRLLLDLDNGDYVTSLAFRPDGGALAALSRSDGLTVWSLDDRRGISTLRGLAHPIARVRFSPDGRQVAALGHDWSVAVWDVDSGRLRHVFSVTPGVTSDNAALAFDRQTAWLAFASGSEARLWDLSTGALVRRWELPTGLCDNLSFDAGRLLLARAETQGGREPPFGNDPKAHPRVYRLRDLLAPNPLTALGEWPDLNVRVHAAAGPTADGLFIAEGLRDGADGRTQRVVAFDGMTGAVRWSKTQPRPAHVSALHLDPTGCFLSYRSSEEDDEEFLVETTTGRIIRSWHGLTGCVGPGARDVVLNRADADGGPGSVYARFGPDGAPRMCLGLETLMIQPQEFRADGRLLVRGHNDGTVTLLDRESVRRRLNEAGLGWPVDEGS